MGDIMIVFLHRVTDDMNISAVFRYCCFVNKRILVCTTDWYVANEDMWMSLADEMKAEQDGTLQFLLTFILHCMQKKSGH